MTRLDSATARYRQQYRQEEVSSRYSGPLHFSFTLTVGIAAIVASALQVEAPSPWDWLAIPMTFVYANLAEYWGHRGPMHHPVRGLGIVFRRHAGQHHRFFTADQMTFDRRCDYKAVLFPPVMIGFFLVVFALPYWLIVSWLWTTNAAWLGVATAVAYFLNYELLHFAYHCDDRSWIGRFPGVARLRKLHHAHHDPMLMQKCNFNITYPIGDCLFRTLKRPAGERR